jgi:hypothetical protein
MKKTTCFHRGTIPILSFLFLIISVLTFKSSTAQVTIADQDATTGTTSTSHSFTSVAPGALLVLVTMGELHSSTYCDVSSSPSLTWTKRVDAEAHNSGDAEVWTAVYTAGGNITITSDWLFAANQASYCYVITGQESTLGGASATGNSQSAPSVNITTTRSNSLIVGGIADWNAVNGSSRTYRDGSVTERMYHFVTGSFTAYAFDRSAASVTTYTEGLSAPTGQSGGTVLYEIRPPIPADTIPPSSFTLSATDTTCTSVDLSWTAATDNIGVTGYEIWVDGNYVTTTTNLTYTVTGLSPSTQYSIYIKAKDAANNTTNSNTITPTTLSTGCTSCGLTLVSTNTATGSGSSVNSLTGVPAGALLVLACQDEGHSTNATVNSTPSLTWTKRADAQATNSGNSEIWTAVFTAGGNISITSDFSNYNHSSVCYVITGQETTLSGASATGNSQSAPSVNITTTKANSIIIGAVADWNAVNGSSRTYLNSPTEIFYHYVSGGFTTYNFYKSAATATTYTQGLSAPTGQSAGTALYEIRCADVGADTTDPVAPAICFTGKTSTTLTIDDITPASDNIGVTGYTVHYTNGTPGSANFSSFPYTITGLTAGASYTVYVTAKDAANNVSSASNNIVRATLAPNLLFDEGFENCDPWDNWSTTQDAGHAWSRQQSGTHANEGSYSFRAEVRSGCDGYVSSGYRSEILPNGITDEGVMWYGMSIYLDAPFSGSNWTGSYGGSILQWHPDNGNGSATLALWGSDGEWDLLTNPGGQHDTRHHYTGTPITRGWHHIVFKVNWSSSGDGYVKVWIDGTLTFDLAHGVASSWYGPSGSMSTSVVEDIDWNSEGRYLKVGMNRWGTCSTPGCPSGSQGPCDTWILYYDNVRIGDENAVYSDVAPLTGGSFRMAPTPIKPQEVIKPNEFTLGQNFPNPFNKQTTIQFALPQAEKVNLALFDINGRLVKVLLNGSKDAGRHSVNLNTGSLPAGIYYYTIKAGKFTDTKKLTIQ